MTKRNDSGQTLVETAISLSLFLVMVLGVIEFGYIFNTKVNLQNAVRQAGRYAITGQCIGGVNGIGCTQTRYNSIITTIENASLGRVTASEIQIVCTPEGGGCPNPAGGPGDIITITVTYPYQFLTGPIAAFFPGHAYTMTVSSSFTNEPFPPGES